MPAAVEDAAAGTDALAAAGGALQPLLTAPVAGGYVCTGYDAFLTHEPGPLEAMALLHARVARVVFARADPDHGALGGQGAGGMRLHQLRSLNHHYLVYRGFS